MTNIGSVNRFVSLCVYNATKSVVQKPKMIPVLKSGLKTLTPVFKSIKPKTHQVSIEDVKSLFIDGKMNGGQLHKYMYSIKAYLLLKSIFDIHKFKLWKHSVDLSKKLTTQDYKDIAELMNLHNGKFIDKWRGFSDFDDIPNFQKLALFVRSMKRTNQLSFFKNLSEQEWATCVDGIVNRPKEVIRPLLEYKFNSTNINWGLTKGYCKNEIYEKIKKIDQFLDTQKTRCKLDVYRGEGQFGIFSQIKPDKKTTLDKILERYTDEINNGGHSQKEIKEFINKKILSVELTQNRFMSTGLTRKAGEDYAKKLLWNISVPEGTKASMIEGYNVERKAEYELLIQRDSILKIKDAIFDHDNHRWEMWVDLLQQS